MSQYSHGSCVISVGTTAIVIWIKKKCVIQYYTTQKCIGIRRPREVGFAEPMEEESREPAQRTTGTWLPRAPAEALHEATRACQLGLWTAQDREALMAGKP